MADIRSSYKGFVLAVGGPPHSGKSIFIAELYRQLLRRKPTGTFLQRACPDGEGMWSDEADPAVTARIRRKGEFSPEFVSFVLKAIENLGLYFPRVLVDLGGVRDEKNAEILRRSTHCIILSSSEAKPWIDFAQTQGCMPLAVLRSQLEKQTDGTLVEGHKSEIDLSQEPVQGTIWQLDRYGSTDAFSGAISDFADWLIREPQPMMSQSIRCKSDFEGDLDKPLGSLRVDPR